MGKKTITKSKTVSAHSAGGQFLADRLKILLKKEGLTFNELAEKLNISSTGLYLSFKRGKVTIVTLEKIGIILKVHPFYFFENDIIERLTEEVTRHSPNPDLKSFLMGFSRDVSKGMPLDQAAYKNIDPDGHRTGLLM